MINVNVCKKESSFEDGTYKLTLSEESNIVINESENVKFLVNNLNKNINIKLNEYSNLEIDLINTVDSTINIDLLDKATLNIKYIASNSSNLKLNINLVGYESKAFVKALVVNKDCNSCVETNVYHLAKNTESDVSSYGVSIENSTIVFDTNGTIKNKMSGSNCNQIARGIIVGKKANVKSFPKLFIDEFDVKANHGAAIGKMSDDELFYLMSRGLTKDEAFKLILSGIINPVLSLVFDEENKNFIEKEIYKNI